jgi:hypothetical protein
MNLDYFAGLLTEYWYILLPLLLLSGAEARRKQSRARVIQVLSRAIGSIAAIIIALGVFGLLIR